MMALPSQVLIHHDTGLALTADKATGRPPLPEPCDNALLTYLPHPFPSMKGSQDSPRKLVKA